MARMDTVAIKVQEPVRQDLSDGEAHRKAFVELVPSFTYLYAPQSEMLLGRLLDGRLRIIEPFMVKLSDGEGQIIAEAPEVGEVGVGKTRAEAIHDLQATLGELYFTLADNVERLDSSLLITWETVQRKIGRRS